MRRCLIFLLFMTLLGCAPANQIVKTDLPVTHPSPTPRLGKLTLVEFYAVT